MSRERWIEGALFAGATLGSGALALALGQDANFDQLNYHVYLGWSLVAGRLDLDVAPAGLGSYINPVVQAIHYLGLTCLPPRLFGFALGAVHGLNSYLVYRLARLVLRGVGHERALSAVAGLVAASGPCAVSLLATTFGDNLVSILVLAAFLSLLRAADAPEHAWTSRLALAGLLGGTAAALKLTLAPFALALAAAVVLVSVRARRVGGVLAFGAGGVAGVLLGGGYWGFQLWRRFGNPVFPFFNNVFRSPYLPHVALQDARWAPQGWMDLVAAPVQMAFGRTDRLQEVPFRDARYLVLVAAAAAAALVLWRKRASEPAPASAAAIVVGWLAAYVAWGAVFHYYRYFAAGEFLAPVAILALLRMLPGRHLARSWLAVALVVVATVKTGSWGRMTWREEPLHVRVPLATAQPAAVVVDGLGFSFVLPFFPPGTRFYSAYGTSVALETLTARELARHQGPVFRLFPQAAPPTPLEKYGLVDEGPCETVRTGGRGRLSLCPLVRVSP